MMKRITTYMENGRKFFICKAENQGDANGYWGFEDKDVDEKTGKLLKQFNGINGHHSDSLEETIQMVSGTIRVDALVEAGMDRMDAAIKVVQEQYMARLGA